MRGLTNWNQTPFTRLTETYKKQQPYICSISPFESGFGFEWFDRGSDEAHKVIVHKYESYDAPIEYPLTDRFIKLQGLDDCCDYEFTVWRNDMSACSATRLVRTGKSLGTVVNYLHPQDDFYKHSGKFLGSPCIVKLPSGKLLCSMDFHMGGDGENLSIIFKSEDRGETWRYVTELSPCFWGKLFVHRDKLYMMACAGVYGDVIIGCSEDEGETWSTPTHIVHGVHGDYGGHHTPAPVIEHNGRLYTTFEYGAWKFQTFYHSLLSIDCDADLMKAENWIFTEPAAVNKDAEGMPESAVTTAIEGNPVVLPDGNVAVLLRLDPLYMTKWEYNRAMLVRSDPNNLEAPLQFDRVIDMPVGMRNRFTIYRDPNSACYFAVCNKWEADHFGRGILVLAVSTDCINWTEVKTVADSREAGKHGVTKLAYSYPDFTYDGDDILILSRTAANAPNNQHDNNMITFFRVKNYKQYRIGD